jgi:hypothetical protein
MITGQYKNLFLCICNGQSKNIKKAISFATAPKIGKILIK